MILNILQVGLVECQDTIKTCKEIDKMSIDFMINDSL